MSTRTCGNCATTKVCYYRGIVNPCDQHVLDRMHTDLRRKAKALIGKALSFEEGRFVTSATTLEIFTVKQASWLRSIHARLCV